MSEHEDIAMLEGFDLHAALQSLDRGNLSVKAKAAGEEQRRRDSIEQRRRILIDALLSMSLHDARALLR